MGNRRQRQSDKPADDRIHLRQSGSPLVSDHLEHLLDANRGERDDRIAKLNRQPREAHALLPEQPILLTAPVKHLARPAREDEDVLAVAHQRAGVLAGPPHHSGALEQIAPHGDPVMGVFAEPPKANAPPFPQLSRHERDVDESKQGVVADEQRAARRNPLDSVDLRLGDALQWCKDRRHPVHLRVRRSWRERRGGGGHGLGTAAPRAIHAPSRAIL